jgi:hypothetical protein
VTGPAPICMWCSRLRANGLKCDAYPDGIPYEIIENRVDHREPLPRDQGLQFRQDPKKEPLPAHTIALVEAGIPSLPQVAKKPIDAATQKRALRRFAAVVGEDVKITRSSGS